MAKDFFIKTDDLVNLTLALQNINDVALPFAVQNTLNRVARDVKINTLTDTTSKHFKLKKKAFFKANSGFKSHKAKEVNYNINRLKAEVGIIEARKPFDKATEQVGHQETAKPIDRSINPLGSKPKSKGIIDILSKKPEIYEAGNSDKFIQTIGRAKRRGSGVIFKKGNRGTLRKINTFKRRKPTKRNPFRYLIKTTPVASYIKGGEVKLTKRRPFLTEAVEKSMNSKLEKIFKEQAEDQVKRALQRKLKQ